MRPFRAPMSVCIKRHGSSIAGQALVAVVCASLGFFAGGCAMAPPAPVGVTSGGQQDIAAARRAIEEGGIPDPVAITVEGFLSEHSIPAQQPEDAGLLFVSPSVSWNADFDAFTPLATVQVGFGTTIDEATFQRDPLNLCLVIDRSGSMADAIDVRSGTSKLEAVKIAIDRLLAQLDGRDTVSVVAFNSRATTLLTAAAGNDLAAIKSAYDTLDATGGTDLVRGMRRGYRLVASHRDDVRSDRLIVFTDALLTQSQEQRAEWFIDVMEEFAGDGIGATLFGVGTDFGHEIAYDISQVRGGNYFFLGDYERIVAVFDEEFDYLVTPVAYDVALSVTVPYVFDVVDVYGVPVDEPQPHEMVIDIPTLFLSARQGGGGVLVRLRPGAQVDRMQDNALAEIVLSYTTPDGKGVTASAAVAVLPGTIDPAEDLPYFENDAAQRGTLLLNTALVLKRACEDAYWSWDFYYYDYNYSPPNERRAIARLEEFLAYFDTMAEGLADRPSDTSRSLSEERALLEQLLANIRG